MAVGDSQKVLLSCAATIGAFVVAFASFFVFWAVAENWRYGVLAAFISFFLLLTVATIVMSTVREPSAFLTWVPFSLGVFYTAVPDLPLPFDDAAVASAGAIATFALWLKRQPDVSKAVVVPLLLAALYTLVGAFIPGPVDELLVSGIAAASAVAIGGSRPKALISAPPDPPDAAMPVAKEDTLL